MTADNLLVLGILIVAVVLFVSERFRVDVVAMMVLAALALTNLVTPEEAFSGFSSPAVITVWAVFIVSGGLTRSGVADIIARQVIRFAGRSQLRLTILIMLAVGGMSAFMNNIGAVAILLPAVMSVARETDIPPSKLLIPLAWASLLGGNMTMIGTPPNILASSILESYGNIEPFSFFDFTPMGIVVLAAGVLYMVLIGRRLLPNRMPGGELVDSYPVQEYLTEARLLEDSVLVGQTVKEADLENTHGLNVIHIHLCCQEGETVPATTEHRLQVGDELHLEASAEAILAASRTLGIELVADRSIQPWEDDASRAAFELAEVVLAPDSRFRGRTLKDIDFRARFGLAILAIRHRGRTLFSRLGDVSLEFGDSLLVQGPVDKINLLRRERGLLLLDMPPMETRRTNKAPVAVAILLGVLVVVTAGWLHVAAAMFIGALLMVLSGTLTMDEAYRSIEWKSVFLIAGMLPLGLAMENTGTAQLLADQIVNLVGDWGPLAVMMGIFVMTGLLTEVMSNAAATVLAVPIAIDAAQGLGADPRAFVMAIVIAASTSFLMPIGHQVNVLIFGPGGYRFSDYTKVGVLLNVVLFILTATILPLIWPLFP
ncbi:MAG: SLC13 family permease [Anaerolineae bacterium]|jgi:di/tricarboxylate transporter